MNSTPKTEKNQPRKPKFVKERDLLVRQDEKLHVLHEIFEYAYDLSIPEFFVLIFVFRRTAQYNKSQERITMRDFIQGKADNRGIGLSKNTIIKAINSLIEKKFIIKSGFDIRTYKYELNLKKIKELKKPKDKQKKIYKIKGIIGKPTHPIARLAKRKRWDWALSDNKIYCRNHDKLHIILDILDLEVPLPALSILIFIYRRTILWDRYSERITLSEFTEGKDRTRGTRLSKPTVIKWIKYLEKNKFIIRKEIYDEVADYEYEINLLRIDIVKGDPSKKTEDKGKLL